MTFNWVFEYQPIASETLTQPSCYNRAENNLLADEKGPHDQEPGRCLVYTLGIQLLFKKQTQMP